MAKSLDPSLNTSGVKPESERARIVRLMKISGIGIGVGVATAVTAGLAVPVVAAGLGAGAASLGIGGAAGLTTFLSTSVGSATVAGLVGAGSASLTGWRYGRRVGRLKVFRFVEIPRVQLLNSVYQRLDPAECRLLDERLYRRQDFFDKPPKKRKGWMLTSKLMNRKRSLDILSPHQASASILDEVGPTYVHIGTIICVEGWIKRKGRLVTQRPATPTGSGPDVQHFPSLNLDAADAALVDDFDLCSSEDPCRAIDFPCSVTPNVRSSLCSEDVTVSKEREPSTDPIVLPLTTASTYDNEEDSTVGRRTEQWVRLAEWSTVFALEWDPSLLENLGSHIYEIQTCFAVSMAQTWLTFSAAGHITTPLSWPLGLIQFANNLDNIWAMCMSRAEQASRALAAAIKDTKSMFPVSLVGFSMGARVIFYALVHLAQEGQLNLVHNVVLAGVPTSHNSKNWKLARSAVTGRFVNAFSPKDWMLGFLYRYNEWQLHVAGIQAVPSPRSIENVDIGDVIKSHADYCEKMPQVLRLVNYPTKCNSF